jgi:hypothetical protein
MHRVLRGCIRLQNRGRYGKHPGRNGPLTRGENCAECALVVVSPAGLTRKGSAVRVCLLPPPTYAPLNYLARNTSSDEKRLKSEGVL